MRPMNRPGWALILSTAVVWPASALAQAPPNSTTNTIGSHQIDRFEAIRQLQADLGANPNNLGNWVILGELAHEVALDVPTEQDDAYYRISRDAYERALRLDPNNAGLKAAVQFARDQEANATSFDEQRKRGVTTYLEARRREMATNGATPMIKVYEPQPYPVDPNQRGVPTGAGVTQQPIIIQQPGLTQQPGVAQPAYSQTAYPQPTYRPYSNAQGQPLQYNQYSNGYVPPSNINPAAPPTTLRQFGQQLPGLLLNEATRGRPR